MKLGLRATNLATVALSDVTTLSSMSWQCSGVRYSSTCAGRWHLNASAWIERV